MREALDLTTVDAIGVETIHVVLTEYGPDLSCFPTEKQFVSRATLAARRRTSGGKPVRKKKRNSASHPCGGRASNGGNYPVATARLRWEPATAILQPDWEATWPSSLPPENWPITSTACCVGDRSI